MKILIVSTPKTGNTWVKNLLSFIYDLPMVKVGANFERGEVEGLGPRWVAQEHYLPSRGLLDWAREAGGLFVTTVRHPGDTLVSLVRYVDTFKDEPAMEKGRVEQLTGAEASDAARMVEFLSGSFFCDLNISIVWMCAGISHVLRYEDLWRDPLTTLREFTDRIQPVSIDRLERAVECCAIDLLRRVPGNKAGFFRHGRVGDWKRELSADQRETLRVVAPYPAQFAFLGYTMESDDPQTTLPRRPRPSRNPFKETRHFDNGVPVPAIVEKLYLAQEPERTQGWDPVWRVDPPGSFFRWLNSPAEGETAVAGGLPAMTQLAAFILYWRADVQKAFPRPRDENRIDFLEWFINTAPVEYGLTAAYVDPVRIPFMSWANAAADGDSAPLPLPLVSNYMMHYYRQRQDLRQAYPEPFGLDRLDFVNWFVLTGRWEHKLHRDFVVPMVSSWCGQSGTASWQKLFFPSPLAK